MNFSTTIVTDSNEKRRIIETCDDAFTISVTGRSNYEELLAKIDKFAVFLGAYTEAGEIAGYSAFYANDVESRTAFITLFCARKEMQRMHLGSGLMSATIDESRRRGMKLIRLEVLKRDEGAIAFYKRCGFAITGDAGEASYYMARGI